MIPDFINVKIQTNPPAEIYIDKQKVGYNSFQGRQLIGLHTIEVKKENYYTGKQVKQFDQGEDISFDFKLKPISSKLFLNTTPPFATIYIDGIDSGKTPAIKELIIGHHSVEYLLSGYKPYKREINLVQGNADSIFVALEEIKSTSVYLSCQDSFAWFSIDNGPIQYFPKMVVVDYGKHTVVTYSNQHKPAIREFAVNQPNLTLSLKIGENIAEPKQLNPVVGAEQLINKIENSDSVLGIKSNLNSLDNSLLKNIVCSYYSEVQSKRVNAEKYFSDNIVQYISMRNITRKELEKELRKSSNEFTDVKIDVDTTQFKFVRTFNNVNFYNYYVHFHCYRTSKGKFEDCDILIELGVDESEKFVSYRELKIDNLRFNDSYNSPKSEASSAPANMAAGYSSSSLNGGSVPAQYGSGASMPSAGGNSAGNSSSYTQSGNVTTPNPNGNSRSYSSPSPSRNNGSASPVPDQLRKQNQGAKSNNPGYGGSSRSSYGGGSYGGGRSSGGRSVGGHR